MLEMDRRGGHVSSQANPVAERILRPRYLCFLREEGMHAIIMNVDDWYVYMPSCFRPVLTCSG
jgi:hypothetical protein